MNAINKTLHFNGGGGGVNTRHNLSSFIQVGQLKKIVVLFFFFSLTVDIT